MQAGDVLLANSCGLGCGQVVGKWALPLSFCSRAQRPHMRGHGTSFPLVPLISLLREAHCCIQTGFCWEGRTLLRRYQYSQDNCAGLLCLIPSQCSLCGSLGTPGAMSGAWSFLRVPECCFARVVPAPPQQSALLYRVLLGSKQKLKVQCLAPP